MSAVTYEDIERIEAGVELFQLLYVILFHEMEQRIALMEITEDECGNA